MSLSVVMLMNSWRADSLYFTHQRCLVTTPWNTCECSEALSGFSGKDDKFDSDFSHGPRGYGTLCATIATSAVNPCCLFLPIP